MVDRDLSQLAGAYLSGTPVRIMKERVAWSEAPTRDNMADMDTPLLTIAITTFERPLSLQRAIDSILRQELPAGMQVEVLVIDDGSTSESFRSHWNRWREKPTHSGFGFRYLRNIRPSFGPSAGRNVAIDVARGKHLMYLDDDDQIAESALDAVLQHLRRSAAQRTSLRYRKGEKSVYLAPVGVHENLGIIDSLWSMITNSIWEVSHLREIGARFPSGVQFGEDSEFCLYFSARAERFAALCDQDYLIFGDAVAGEAEHLSQGRNGWEGFLRGILAHLWRMSTTISETSLPSYARHDLASKCLLGRGLRSYQLVRRIGQLSDDELAHELLRRYSEIVNEAIPDGVSDRYAREHNLVREIESIRKADLGALRDCLLSASP